LDLNEDVFNLTYVIGFYVTNSFFFSLPVQNTNQITVLIRNQVLRQVISDTFFTEANWSVIKTKPDVTH
jgi:hypothetical protein